MLIGTYFLPIPPVKMTATIASLLHQPDDNVIGRPASSSQGLWCCRVGWVNNDLQFPCIAFLGGPIILSQ